MKGELKRGCTISLGRLQYIRWVTAGPTQKTKSKWLFRCFVVEALKSVELLEYMTIAKHNSLLRYMFTFVSVSSSAVH
jgi:hypothetical protein